MARLTPATCHSFASRYSSSASAARKDRVRPASRTRRSRSGSIPGTASLSGQFPNDRRHENCLVAGSDSRPDLAQSLYRRREPGRRAADRVAHPSRCGRQSANGATRPRTGDPRTRHSTDSLHRTVPCTRRDHPDFARLPRRSAMAGALLASFVSISRLGGSLQPGYPLPRIELH
jgi:hypothetical protein